MIEDGHEKHIKNVVILKEKHRGTLVCHGFKSWQGMIIIKGMRLGNYLIELTSNQFIIKIKNPRLS